MMMRLLRLFPFFRCAICGTVALINVLHPVIHGTPLDSGALDAVMAQLDMMAMSLAPVKE
jgi:hypothetical protein